MAGLLAGPTLCRSAAAATTTYSGPTGAFTIDLGDTALLINGADITGDVLDNGTLEFGLTDNLTVSNLISGLGDVLLTNTGTITFSGSNSYQNGTTVRYGELVITSGGVIDHLAADLVVGSLSGDSGTLSLAGGRIANFDGVLGQNAGSYGAATVGSGTWAIDNDLTVGYAGAGTLTLSGGSVDIAGAAWLGRDAGGSGELTMTGGTLAIGSVLNIGFGGTGDLTLDGGSVTDIDGYLGVNPSSSGTATITSGTWFNSRNLYVGSGGGGSGTLNIATGGVVVVGDTLFRDSTLGTINLDAGGTLVIGSGSSTGTLDTDLTNNGTLVFDFSGTSTYNYVISGSGGVVKSGVGVLQLTGSNTYSGETDILDGRIEVLGAIGNSSATVAIGDSSGAVGGLDVNGGYVGSSLLELSNGDLNLLTGLIETGTARIGVFGTGTATVTGGLLSIDNSLYVGYSGTGTMNIDAGNVVSHETMLGTLSGDSGTVSVTNGGIWANLGDLTVGGTGTGVLNISNFGQVLVTGTLSKGAAGTISLNPDGVLRIGNGGTAGTLAADLTDNGLVVFNRSNDSTYAGMIDGSGAVTKVGAGALTISGSNRYSGITTIEAGSFYVDGYLGHTSVVVNAGALLGGSGTVLGDVTVGGVTGTAVISPGSLSGDYASLSLGSLSLMAGSLTQLSVSGTEAGLSYDQIAGVGDAPMIVYGGDLEIALSGSYADNTTFHLFTNFTSESGEFNSITLDATGPYAALSGPFTYDVSTGLWATNWTTSHQRVVFSTVTGDLIVVPEPSTIVLGAFGVGFAGLLRWRRRRRRGVRVASDQA